MRYIEYIPTSNKSLFYISGGENRFLNQTEVYENDAICLKEGQITYWEIDFVVVTHNLNGKITFSIRDLTSNEKIKQELIPYSAEKLIKAILLNDITQIGYDMNYGKIFRGVFKASKIGNLVFLEYLTSKEAYTAFLHF